jgi:heterodisulfide reductase subunit A
MNAGEIKVEAIVAEVDEDKCTICGICVKVCPYNAISIDKKNKIPAKVIKASCTGCGTCAAECPPFAISINHFTDEQIMTQIDAILLDEPEKKVVVFACNWCSYAGADFAGVSRFQYPTTTYLIRTMCSGRVAEKFIWHTLVKGAAIVLVSGCHLGDCHYNKANEWTVKRMKKVWKRMKKLGISKERVHLEWISASEGTRFAKIMDSLENLRQRVTPKEIEETKQILKPLIESGKIFKL